MTKVERAHVSVLLSVVAPRCFNCERPATRFLSKSKTQGEVDEMHVAFDRYACDAHQDPHDVMRWRDLPAADAIRALTKLIGGA